SVVKAKPVVPQTMPIVFAMGGDPIKLGVVASLARPGDNITGENFLLSDLAAKQVELLHELVPTAAVLGFLVNPNAPTSADATREGQPATVAPGHTLVLARASAASAIEPALALLAHHHIAALFVNADPLYNVNAPHIVALAARYKMPTIPSWEGFAADGGLMSY